MSSTSLKSSPVANNCFFRPSTWEHAMNFSRQTCVFIRKVLSEILLDFKKKKKIQLDTFSEYETDHLDYTLNKISISSDSLQ